MLGHFEVGDLPLQPATAIDKHKHRTFRIPVVDHVIDPFGLDLDPQFLADLPHHAVTGVLARLDLAARELPEQRIRDILPASGEEKSPLVFDERGSNEKGIHGDLSVKKNPARGRT
jgi:hypothetical protein